MSNKIIYSFSIERTKDKTKHTLNIHQNATIGEMKKVRKHMITELNDIEREIEAY